MVSDFELCFGSGRSTILKAMILLSLENHCYSFFCKGVFDEEMFCLSVARKLRIRPGGVGVFLVKCTAGVVLQRG